MDHRDAGQPVRVGGRRPDDEGAAHAEADGADAACIGPWLRVDESQQRTRVAFGGGAVQRRHQAEHVLQLVLVAFREEPVPRAAVIEIAQHDEIAHGGKPPRHVVQLLALAGGVHVEQQHRKGAAFVGVDDEAVHRAVGGGDIEVVFDQAGLPAAVARPTASKKAPSSPPSSAPSRRTLLHRSRPCGRTVAMASATLPTRRPPAR